MRIVLLGPPGSGKSELSEKISDHYGMPVITVASVMQRAAAENSELGRLAKEAMDMSRVSDELLLALLRIQLPQTDLGKGFILVDLPKNAGQADVLDSVLNDLGAGVEAVLNLEVDRDELMERLVGRIACDHCGAQYNLYVNPPMVDGVCDACGARVVRRPDDYEETISNRLRVYEGQMGPLLQYYSLGEKLHRVEADSGIPKAWKAVRKLLDGLPPSELPGSVTDAPAAAEPKAKTKAKAKAKAGVKSAEPEKAEKAEKPEKADKPVKRAGMIMAAAKKADSEKRVSPAKKSGKKSKSKSKSKSDKPTASARKTPAAKKAAPAKPAAKKVAAKKSVSKKAGAKKAPAKKAATKKVVSKKTVAKKTVASKKRVAKKAAAKKSTTKKVIAKKVIAKKAAAKKAVAKKVVAKKVVAKKVVAKKVAKKKAVAKKAVAKKAVAKKTPVKRSASKKKSARR